MEIQTLALQDECAYAVLLEVVIDSRQCTAFEVLEGEGRGPRTWAVDVACKAFTGMVGGYRGCRCMIDRLLYAFEVLEE